jgi:hypothetical protein
MLPCCDTGDIQQDQDFLAPPPLRGRSLLQGLEEYLDVARALSMLLNQCAFSHSQRSLLLSIAQKAKAAREPNKIREKIPVMRKARSALQWRIIRRRHEGDPLLLSQIPTQGKQSDAMALNTQYPHLPQAAFGSAAGNAAHAQSPGR